jgi:hypothetical protein
MHTPSLTLAPNIDLAPFSIEGAAFPNAITINLLFGVSEYLVAPICITLPSTEILAATAAQGSAAFNAAVIIAATSRRRGILAFIELKTVETSIMTHPIVINCQIIEDFCFDKIR